MRKQDNAQSDVSSTGQRQKSNYALIEMPNDPIRRGSRVDGVERKIADLPTPVFHRQIRQIVAPAPRSVFLAGRAANPAVKLPEHRCYKALLFG
ncbi:hypothetical protein M8523_01845 [Hyphomicrobiales bacterium BP6-180914]|uniref:Uncharacterized protein n=1 Tax=Lichenifustis flavocetrariae TaxID=2949735 RepID=A0AA41YXP5_9HYPH|nr:hypothetical protein [Lichenifustis flavocetrariae]